jgi:cellobiose-specific phosphotransferase system component IIA
MVVLVLQSSYQIIHSSPLSRKEKLEAEAKAGTEKFEEITKKWETALQKEIPQELHEVQCSLLSTSA